MAVFIPARSDFGYRLNSCTSFQRISFGREVSRPLRGDEQITVQKVEQVVTSFRRWATFYSIAYRPVVWIVLGLGLVAAGSVLPEIGLLYEVAAITLRAIGGFIFGHALGGFSHMNQIASHFRESAAEADAVLEKLNPLDSNLEIRLNYG